MFSGAAPSTSATPSPVVEAPQNFLTAALSPPQSQLSSVLTPSPASAPSSAADISRDFTTWLTAPTQSQQPPAMSPQNPCEAANQPIENYPLAIPGPFGKAAPFPALTAVPKSQPVSSQEASQTHSPALSPGGHLIPSAPFLLQLLKSHFVGSPRCFPKP